MKSIPNAKFLGPLRLAGPISALLLLAFCDHGLAAADPFAEFVRSSDPRTSADELRGFHVPPGFEVQLVAAEPDIGKPMNMAFDARGRLWITQSREYPFPAPTNRPARDAIKILDGIGADGRARKITTFAEGLNIPIGIYPYRGGAIAFSIPYIYLLQDTDGDGRADRQEVLLGRQGFEKDTHGLTSSFRRGFDGWLYADHGYNNDTTLTAGDGSSINMNSGNTYRFRIDGSRVEQFTWGQVNPFGLMFDPLGDLWSADCHSSPVYVLLRGAYYPSFGKPHDGLGFGPDICAHSHGSTAIAGIVYYDAESFPPAYRGNTFIGNVMTCRVNRDSFAWHGSTRVAREEPDFLASDDPWFRPVDLQLGPDGALYVADFYNRIIGHYEVPLTHPGRDRERGRIWRIVYRGGDTQTAVMKFDVSRSSVDAIIAELGSANLARRMLAMNELVDRVGNAAIRPVQRAVRRTANPHLKIHGLWVLHRLGGLDEKTLATACTDPSRDVRLHAQRILSEIEGWSPAQRHLARAGLRDSDAFVQRAAADALGRHPDFENLRPLLDRRHEASAEDTELVYKIRQSLRDQLRQPASFARLPLPQWSEGNERAIADVAMGVPSPEAASFLLRHLQNYSEPRETMTACLRHAARYLPEQDLDAVASLTRARFGEDLEFQMVLFRSVQDGTEQRGTKLSGGARAWGAELARNLLASTDKDAGQWHNTPVEGMAKTDNPWVTQTRDSADGKKDSPFLTSLPLGEQLTGILRSGTFSIPSKFTFFLAGHDGFPDKPAQKRNVVRLHAADTQEVLAEQFPFRNDTARLVTWDLTAHAGKSGYLEIIDGDNGSAYAWLAVGRFEPSVIEVPRLNPSQRSQRQQAAADLVRTLRLADLEPQLKQMLAQPSTEPAAGAAAAQALLALQPNDLLAALVPMIADPGTPAALRERISRTFAPDNRSDATSVLSEAMRTSSRRLQTKLAQTLAGNPQGAETLLQMVSAGQAPASLLQEPAVKDKLLASKADHAAERIEQLTRGLSPANVEIQRLVDRRRKGFDPARSSLTKGDQLFTKNCRVCHQLDGTGNLIGPQLDGIGNRGLERLCEDVLDPNRSVDPAFRSTLFTLADGDVVSGLFRREEGGTVVLADSTGKEITISKSTITGRRESTTSLMPENFGELLSQEDFNDLMSFLLSKSVTASRN